MTGEIARVCGGFMHMAGHLTAKRRKPKLRQRRSHPCMAHSVEEYLTLKGEDESAIVSNLLPLSGALNIFGAPKAGKSYLSLQLADAIGNPRMADFLGFPINVHGEVLYIQIDTPRNLWID